MTDSPIPGVSQEEIQEAFEEMYEDGKNESCAICDCDLHWGKCGESSKHLQWEDMQKLLPKGWKLIEYLPSIYEEADTVIYATKGKNSLALVRSKDGTGEDDDTILEAVLFHGEMIGDTLLGEYTFPKELETGRAQRWFADVVYSFDKHGGF